MDAAVPPFDAADPVVGMVHLPPLPGSPRSDGDRDAVRERARRDARALAGGGVDGVLVENFGDAPFHPDDVPKHVVASLTDATRTVVEAVDVPVGVNVLRNDAPAAVAVAAAAGAAFVRANVHAGARVTDQGVLEGRAHRTLRLRDRLDPDVRVFADLSVKHATPLGPERDPAPALAEVVERGFADAVLVTGPESGAAVDTDRLRRVVDARDDRGLEVPVLVGSGVTPETAPGLLDLADGLVVGTAFERDGETGAPVEEARVRRLVERVG
ncbi:MAG: BtpA/SgcQ family protein [Haloferacaceae archaeon]